MKSRTTRSRRRKSAISWPEICVEKADEGAFANVHIWGSGYVELTPAPLRQHGQACIQIADEIDAAKENPGD